MDCDYRSRLSLNSQCCAKKTQEQKQQINKHRHSKQNKKRRGWREKRGVQTGKKEKGEGGEGQRRGERERESFEPPSSWDFYCFHFYLAASFLPFCQFSFPFLCFLFLSHLCTCCPPRSQNSQRGAFCTEINDHTDLTRKRVICLAQFMKYLFCQLIVLVHLHKLWSAYPTALVA